MLERVQDFLSMVLLAVMVLPLVPVALVGLLAFLVWALVWLVPCIALHWVLSGIGLLPPVD